MRGLKLTILTVILLGIGAATGYFVSVKTEHIRCPKDLSRALQGCETVATTMNNMLFKSDWETFNCREELAHEKERIRKIVGTMFRYGWSPLDKNDEMEN